MCIRSIPSIYMPFIYRLNDYLQSSSFLWGRYIFGWTIVGVILLIDVTWLFMSHYSVKMGGIIATLKVVGFLFCWAVGFGGLTLIPRYKLLTQKLRYAEVSETAAWFMLLSCFTSATYVISNLSVTVNTPLVDTNLVRFDRTLGFDWLSVYHWVHSHPVFKHILELAYESMGWQMVAVPAILGLMSRQDNLSEFVQHIMLSSILLLIISTLFPAESAFVHFHITDPNTASTVSNFNLLRNGTMRTIDTLHPQGLVSMPSFHTTIAIFFAYSFRGIPKLLPFAALPNMAMIMSTPTQGGHYLADVLAGILLAAITIQTIKSASGVRLIYSRQYYYAPRMLCGE